MSLWRRLLWLAFVRSQLRWMEQQIGREGFWDSPYAGSLAQEHAHFSRLRKRLEGGLQKALRDFRSGRPQGKEKEEPSSP